MSQSKDEKTVVPVVTATPSDANTEERKYALLQETSGEECESWYYFIKYNGNEEALDFLQKQLETVDWSIIDDLSTFDLETAYLLSEKTAKELTKIDINHFSPHRKFDGTLKKIDLKLKNTYSTEKKIKKVFRKLGYGKIEDYIDQEDVDPEDLVGSDEDSSSDSDSMSDLADSEEDSDHKEEPKPKKKGQLPGVPTAKNIPIPRYAKAKKKHK